MLKQIILSGYCALLLAVSSDAAHIKFKGYRFESYVVGDNLSRFPEARKKEKSWLQVEEGAEYSIVVNNPLPVRVAAAVTIDGLNTIDGKRTTPKKARKWIIEAHSSITLRGWQTGNSSLRRFVFTNQSGSYAEWKGKRDCKPYNRNLGVIGVAYFWNKAELKRAFNPPRPFAEKGTGKSSRSKSKRAPSADSELEAAPAEPRAGTGMGHKETHNVYEVAFHYDTGMYHSRAVLTIYYEFARNVLQPRPFIEEYSKNEFAPEMP
ncbi:hypothetical protein ACFL5V_10340 [Fibrobacterota bacterium]